MSDDEHVKSGRLKRLSKMAWLTARTTGDLLAGKAKRSLGGGEPKEGASPEMTRAAERILETLGDLKGAALKLGQALAMDPDALPPEARKIVAKLLSQAPQRMPYERVRQAIIEELGKPPEELYARFDQEPIAAASLGQVHSAKLPDSLGGHEVVVKVQYPGVDKALEADMANAGTLVKGIALGGDSVDGRPYYEEIKASLLGELDYLSEAKQALRYRRAAQNYPELVVPEAILERSSKKVLTLTRLIGPSLMEVIEAKPDEAERYRVGLLMILAIWGPFYSARIVHADPHPGNFLVLPDGRLGVLDFGATRLLSKQFAEVYRSFLSAHAHDRGRPEVGPNLIKAGFRFIEDREIDEDDLYAFVNQLADIVERPILTDHDYDFGQDPMVKEARLLFQANPRMALRIKPPAEAVLFYRAVAGLAQDLRLLGAKGRFRPIIREIESRGILPDEAVDSAR
jgi:predicted unusual protein kinase regulating ubiquinone biosynthesis (AarF/ABC1/UbiB family)